MRLSFVLLMVILSFSFTEEKKQASNAELLRLAPQAFFQHPRANQVVDLVNPNHHLLSVCVFQATNLLRQKRGLHLYKPSKSLHLAGQDHIISMRNLHFFDHINPYDSRYRNPRNRVENRGGEYQLIAENIARVNPFKMKGSTYYYEKSGNQYFYYDRNENPLQVMTYAELGKSVVTDWYNSKGHRANLISAELTHLGTAIYIEDNAYKQADLPDVYAVQNFGTN